MVWGGGAEIGSFSLDANIGTSVPNGPGEWAVFVNNVSGADTDFNVYAICADQPSGYAIESNTVDNPAGGQSEASVSCPKRTVVLGGGDVSSSPYPSVNLNSSWPSVVKHIGSWNVDMNNASSLDASVGAFVVCGKKPRGYTMVTGTAIGNPSGVETNAVASCAAGVPLGGGVYSNSPTLTVNTNSTYPLTPEWSSYENNGSAGDDSVTPYVLCAK